MAIGSTLVNLAMFIAFSRTTIALAMICFYTYPGLVTLGAVRFFGEPLDRIRAGALVVASVGLVVVLAPSLLQSGLVVDPIGIALALMASVLQAGCVLLAGRGFGAVPPILSSAVLILVSAVVYVGIAAVTGQFGTLAEPVPGRVAVAVHPARRDRRRGVAVGGEPDRDPDHRRRAHGDPDDARGGGRRGPGRALPGRASLRLPGRRRGRGLAAGAVLQLPRRGERLLVESAHPTV